MFDRSISHAITKLNTFSFPNLSCTHPSTTTIQNYYVRAGGQHGNISVFTLQWKSYGEKKIAVPWRCVLAASNLSKFDPKPAQETFEQLNKTTRIHRHNSLPLTLTTETTTLSTNIEHRLHLPINCLRNHHLNLVHLQLVKNSASLGRSSTS